MDEVLPLRRIIQHLQQYSLFRNYTIQRVNKIFIVNKNAFIEICSSYDEASPIN